MTLSTFQATIANESGDVLPGAEISVILESTGLAATIYSTRGGAALANPMFADSEGFAQFYANAGEYRIVATSGVFSRTWRYVRLGDGGAKDVGEIVNRTVGTAAGNVMEVGAGGWLGEAQTRTLTSASQVASEATKTHVNRPTEIPLSNAFEYCPMLNIASVDTYFQITALHSNARIKVNAGINGTQAWTAELWNDKNTTVDGSGFIKEASPIVKLFSDKIELNDYKELESCEFERVGTGHYIIKGAPLLSRDGWYIETIKDRNGNVYFTLDYEELEDGVHVKTYEPDYSTGRATNGAPVDINEGRFVTLRFEEDKTEE
mgnify:CR=1 FL=1